MLKNQKGRRNLSDYAKTEAALLIKSVLEKEARDRQEAGNNQHRVVEIFPPGENGVLLPEILPEASKGDTRDKLGEMLNMLM